MGRLGARDLTFGSDIDMIFLFDEKHHDLSPEYNKLSKRFVTSLTALTSQGRLYDADTRLRPSGKDGAIAVSVTAFDNYFTNSAWTFEFMALTRARVITGANVLQHSICKVITEQLSRKREKAKLVNDIVDLRSRVDKEFATSNIWKLKYVRGGLMDLDFLAQYFILLNAHNHPLLIRPSAGDVFLGMMEYNLLPLEEGKTLVHAHTFLNSLFTMLRLCGGSELDEQSAVPGLKAMIASCMHRPHFGEVREELRTILAQTHTLWQKHISL
jgi:glutamate-ammonia-ligase adenylyltransferase